MFDVPPNLTTLGVTFISIIGGGVGFNTLLSRRAERRPKPKPKATREEVGQLSQSVDERFEDLRQQIVGLTTKLENRTAQYNGIRSAWYALRDLVISWKGLVERHDPTAPAMSAPLLNLLYNPLPVEDDPEVYDTKRREEILRLREMNIDPDLDETAHRRRPRH